MPSRPSKPCPPAGEAATTTLRSIAGLPRADTSWLVRAYRQFLIRATVSPAIARLERVLDFCFPKSVILYAEKRGAPATPVA